MSRRTSTPGALGDLVGARRSTFSMLPAAGTGISTLGLKNILDAAAENKLDDQDEDFYANSDLIDEFRNINRTIEKIENPKKFIKDRRGAIVNLIVEVTRERKKAYDKYKDEGFSAHESLKKAKIWADFIKKQGMEDINERYPLTEQKEIASRAQTIELLKK